MFQDWQEFRIPNLEFHLASENGVIAILARSIPHKFGRCRTLPTFFLLKFHHLPPLFFSVECSLASRVLPRLSLSVPFHVMKTVTKDGVTSVVAQNEVIIPDLTIKDLLSAIPSVALLSLHVALC